LSPFKCHSEPTAKNLGVAALQIKFTVSAILNFASLDPSLRSG